MIVLSIFQKMRTTLCAEDIQRAFYKMSIQKISSSSLYRILQTLEKNQLIQRADPPTNYVIPVGKRDRTFYVLK